MRYLILLLLSVPLFGQDCGLYGTPIPLRQLPGAYYCKPKQQGTGSVPNTNNVLKGNNIGGILAATPGTDYQLPLTVTNDTNVTGSVSAGAFTLGWTGTLAKARIISSAVYNDQTNTWTTGTQNFSSAAHFIPKAGTAATIPATCTVGEVYMATDAAAGQNWYFCTALNTWTQQINTGGTVTSIATTGPIGGGTITGTGTITCLTCVTSAASLTSTALVTGAGSQGSQTPSATSTLDSSGNLSTPGSVTAGSGSAKTGYMSLQGATSGAQGFSVADVAGTSTLYLIPAATSTGNFLKDNGSTTCPTLPAGAPAACEQLAWAAPTGSGTVAGSTIGQVPVYTAATTVTGSSALTLSGGNLTLGIAGATQGVLSIAGSGGGATAFAVPSSGGGTLTFPGGSDTMVGRATTDTLTNKTFDTASSNTFKINGTTITDKTGTGKAVLDTSAVLTTPSVTTINDANGNPFIKSAATASAVDSVTITNAATANPATVEVDATGTDANINLALKSKGTGTVQLGGSSATVDSSGNLTVASCSGCGSVTAPTMLTWSPWGFGSGTAATVGGAIAAGANFGSVMSFYAPGPIKLSEIDVQVAVASGTACTGGTCGLIFGIATPPTTAAGTFTMLCVTSVATSGGSPDINTPGIIRVNMSSGSDVTAGTCSLPAGFYDLLIATDSIALKLTNFSNGGTSGAGNINQKYPWTFAASGAAISTGNGGALAFNGSITGTNVRSSAGSASATIFEVGFNF